MLLKERNAIIYGGGGGIGGAIARAYAREGARVFLAGRTQQTLGDVADDIRKNGGRAETAVVDALDERSVDEHADAVAREGGSTSVRARFLTSRAAARHMKAQRSGVILTFGGQGDPPAHSRYHLGGLLTGFAAVEAMRRQLAAELGQFGIRVITLRTGGIPETIPEGTEFRRAIAAELNKQSLLGRTATLEDVGNVVVFAASDMARTLTATAINMSCGAILD